MRSLVLAGCATACVLWVGGAAAGPAKPSASVVTPAGSLQSQTPAAVAAPVTITISQYSAQLFGGSEIAAPAQGLPCRLVSRSEIEPEICKRRVLE